MLIRLDPRNERRGPLYRRIYEHLRRAILDGELQAGRRLPSSRELAGELGLSRNVVVVAYEQLLAEGYVEGRVGAGTFVAAPLPEVSPTRDPRPAARTRKPPRLTAFAERAVAERPLDVSPARTPAPRYDFRYGGVDPDARSLEIWRRLLLRRAGELRSGYGPSAGHPELRRQIADYVRQSRGVRCGLGQILVVNGSQQALDLAIRLLVAPRQRVLIEEPHYQGARKAFLAAGAELVPGRVDDEGLDVEALPPGAERARLVYVTPSHQFPTGAVMSLKRRLALLDWADRHDAYILEDDYDSEFRYEGRPVEAVQGLDRHGRTIYAGTLSKVLSPALRLGYLVVPEELAEAFAAVKWLSDRHTPTLEQAAVADFMAEGHFERHLRRLRTRNARRRAALLEAIEEHLGDRVRVTGTNAGVHLLVWLHDIAPEDLGDLIERAAGDGVGVYSCVPYFLAPPAEAGLLLGYATLSSGEIREGIRRLWRTVKAPRRAAGPSPPCRPSPSPSSDSGGGR